MTSKVAIIILIASALLLLRECGGTTALSYFSGPRKYCEPDGKTCLFYLKCLDRNIPCGDKGYARSDGWKCCTTFQKYAPLMSEAAQKWIAVTGQCLQQVLSFLANGKVGATSCDAVKNFAFATHDPCYNLLHPFCDLSRADRNIIENYIFPELTPDSQKVLSEQLKKCREN